MRCTLSILAGGWLILGSAVGALGQAGTWPQNAGATQAAGQAPAFGQATAYGPLTAYGQGMSQAPSYPSVPSVQGAAYAQGTLYPQAGLPAAGAAGPFGQGATGVVQASAFAPASGSQGMRAYEGPASSGGAYYPGSLTAYTDGASYGDSTCCDTCTDGCAVGCGTCDACCYGLFVGGGLVIARPFVEGATAFSRFTPTVAAGNPATSTTLDYQYDVSPRVWFGYIGPGGLGLRTTYWQYDHQPNSLSVMDTGAGEQYEAQVFSSAANFASALTTADGETLGVESGLEVHTLDLEAIYRGRIGRLVYTTGFGARYGGVKHDYLARIVNGTRLLGHNMAFDGLGPTVAFQGRLPVGWGFSGLANTRFSTLIGAQRERIFDENQTSLSRKVDEVVSVIELQTGVEWAVPIEGGRLFAQTTAEGSMWVGGNNPQSDLGNFGFFGIGFMAGLER